MRSIVLTTSWDDGHRSDKRLARILKEYGLRATFYISPQNQEFASDDLLTRQDVKNIGRDFEIGAHTLTHRSLPAISQEEAKWEIVGSKATLEQTTEGVVNTFCYPRGAYRESHVNMVEAAGFKYARTVTRYSFDLKNPYKAGTSLHIYDHRSTGELWRTARFTGFRPKGAWRCLDWAALGRAMFDHVVEQGGIFHIWGHSWEIDRSNDWDRLEDFFRYISGNPKVTYAANGELRTCADS